MDGGRYMLGLSVSEWLLYGGITAMLGVLLLMVLSIVFFRVRGRKLKERLEQEYGKLRF